MTTEREAERAAIVKWLREQASRTTFDTEIRTLEWAAYAIECGDHMEATND